MNASFEVDTSLLKPPSESFICLCLLLFEGRASFLSVAGGACLESFIIVNESLSKHGSLCTSSSFIGGLPSLVSPVTILNLLLTSLTENVEHSAALYSGA